MGTLMGGKMLFSHGSSNARGVAILFRNGFDINLDSFKIDAQGRFLVVKGNIDDNMIISYIQIQYVLLL